jgi:hypothetical protein
MELLWKTKPAWGFMGCNFTALQMVLKLCLKHFWRVSMAIQNSENSEHCNFHGAPKHNVLIEDVTNYRGANK